MIIGVLGRYSVRGAGVCMKWATEMCVKIGKPRILKSNFSSHKLQTVSIPQGLAKKRIKKSTVNGADPGHWSAIAYATADEYDLKLLIDGLQKQGLYQTSSIPEDLQDVLHVSAKYQVEKEPREVFVFRGGSVVFWNMTDIERQAILQFICKFASEPYEDRLVQEEVEMLEYSYTDSNTNFKNGKIWLNKDQPTDLEKYTFSDVMALSVKLGIWEGLLEQLVDRIEPITEDLKNGRAVRLNRSQVIKIMGEIFGLRHMLNLSSDLLDIPDFYWERENLEPLYNKIYAYLDIAKRTRVMNSKLNHCIDLMQLLNDHLNDHHHVRLEWMIIILIMVEVLFEIIHFAEKFI